MRAGGPARAGFGFANALADPRLEIFGRNAATPPQPNDKWSGDAALSTAATAVGAFPLGSATSRDAALLVTQAPGVYTSRVTGVGGATGVALLEIYEVP